MGWFSLGLLSLCWYVLPPIFKTSIPSVDLAAHCLKVTTILTLFVDFPEDALSEHERYFRAGVKTWRLTCSNKKNFIFLECICSVGGNETISCQTRTEQCRKSQYVLRTKGLDDEFLVNKKKKKIHQLCKSTQIHFIHYPFRLTVQRYGRLEPVRADIWVRRGESSGQVTASSHGWRAGWRQTTTQTHTLTCNQFSGAKQPCLWTVGGKRKSWRKHGFSLCTAREKSLKSTPYVTDQHYTQLSMYPNVSVDEILLYSV